MSDNITRLRDAFCELPQTIASQKSSWYRLGGAVQDAVMEVIEINAQEEQRNLERITELSEILGMAVAVLRNDMFYGASLHYPKIFASPFPNDNDGFYMLSPIGIDVKGEAAQFIPQDSEEITGDAKRRLEGLLFAPHGGAVPFIERAPKPLPSDLPAPGE